MTQQHPEQHQDDARNPIALNEVNKPTPASRRLDEAAASASPAPQMLMAGPPPETGLGPDVQANGSLDVDFVVGEEQTDTAGEEAAEGLLLQATADVHAAMSELRRRLQSLEADPFSAESADALISLLIDERWLRAQRNWRVLNEAQSRSSCAAAETSRAYAFHGDHDVLILDECWDLRSETGTQRVSELLADVTDLHRKGLAGRFIFGSQQATSDPAARYYSSPQPSGTDERLLPPDLREKFKARRLGIGVARRPDPEHRSSADGTRALPDAGKQ